MPTFAMILKDLRVNSGMSQKQLAEKIGITKSVISYYETSERTPSPDVLLKLADAFQVSTDYLLGRQEKLFLDVSDLPWEDVRLLETVMDALRRKNSEAQPKVAEEEKETVTAE